MRSNEEPKCSCVVLNYNDAETTIGLVNTIRAYACLRHIIVVDNCSSDDSWGALEQIRMEPKVITIRTDKNGGYGYGNNFGVRYASNELKENMVLIVNPDVAFSEECLCACISFLQRSADVAVVSPVQMDRNGVCAAQYAWNLDSGMRMLLSNELVLRHTFFPNPCAQVDFSKDVEWVDCVPGSFLLVDARKFLQAGGYNENMFLYYEETTLGRRLHNAGWKTALLPKQTYIHMHSVSVNKSIPKIVSQRRIQHQSLLVYLKEEYGYRGIKLGLSRAFLCVCIMEELMAFKIKCFLGEK